MGRLDQDGQWWSMPEVLADEQAAHRRANSEEYTRGHRDAVHPLGAEGVDRERRNQRGVDAAGEPDETSLKPVLRM